MSCYQVLALNNNTGDLSITQGNTVNLVQAIQNFSVKTPVVDFKLDGNNLDLYYRDATGALQLKTVTLPAPGNNSSSISVANTTTITAAIASGVITSAVRVSASSGNAITVNADGLFVPVASAGVQVNSTPSIQTTLNQGIITSSAIISPFTGNSLTLRNDGLYVSPTALSPSQVRNYISATAPILYDATTGIISETLATASTAGYLSSTDWNIFNNKLNGAITVGSVSSTAILKQVDSAKNVEIRSIAVSTGLAINLVGDDIILSTTATVPIVNAGSSQTLPNGTTTASLSGTSSVVTGTIVGNQWITLSGPNTPTFNDRSLLAPALSGLVTGTYAFRLEAIASTGLVGLSNTTITVSSGGGTSDTIFFGVQSGSTPPNAAAVAAGSSETANGANDVSVDWTGLSASAPVYCWFAIPNNGGTYFKTKWFVDSLNHGNIGGSTDLFGSYTQVTISSIVYNVGFTNYQTQFVAPCSLQA